MNAMTIRIPESLHVNLKRIARSEGISANQFIASAAAEKMASIMTLDFLRAEAAQGNRKDFEKFLSAVPA
jgi:HicB family